LKEKLDFEDPLVGHYVVKHGRKRMKIKIVIAVFERKEKKKLFGSWVTPLVGRHVVKEPKAGCQVVNELRGSVTCVYTRGLIGCRVPG
jgi:hypothetical protein